MRKKLMENVYINGKLSCQPKLHVPKTGGETKENMSLFVQYDLFFQKLSAPVSALFPQEPNRGRKLTQNATESMQRIFYTTEKCN